jgi:hypothetical protein
LSTVRKARNSFPSPQRRQRPRNPRVKEVGLHGIDILVEFVDPADLAKVPIEGCRARPRLPKSSLREGNVADVDRYHQHIQYWARAAGKPPAMLTL